MNTVTEINSQQNKTMPLPAKKMHGIVWIMVGVFVAIAGSFPIAMLRVSHKAEFSGFHVISIEQPESTNQK